jgi:long-chain acyl-CoA synthetase
MEKTGSEHAKERPEAFDAYLHAVRPDDLATIIYTSGTTGEPKGVMLTHNNFMSNVLSITSGLPISETDTALSVLPLSHIFERAGFYVFIYNGLEVYYSASFDQVGENLREVGPTVMTAVPRLFEKVYHRIIKKGMAEKGWKRGVFTRSLEVGQRYGELKDTRRWIPPGLRLKQSVA